VSLAKSVGIDSDQWRGVGVSISRLEDRGEANQSLLRFLTKGKKEASQEGKGELVSMSNDAEETENLNDDSKDNWAEYPVEQTVFDSQSKDDDDDGEKPDPGFLAALPSDLRAEVEAQFRQSRREAQSASELARMQEQHCSNKTLETVQSTSNESVERRGPVSLEVESSFSKSKEVRPKKASPTSTQFDPQFMAEMPADIREELEEHQRERKRLKVKEEERLSPAEASFSQLDPEVLAALPDEMMAEVREQYKRRKGEKERKLVSNASLKTGSKEKTVFDALMKQKPGPSLKSSPPKPIKGKRGRPKGSINKNKKAGSKKGGQENSTHADLMSHQEEPMENSNDQEPEVDMEVFDALPDDLKKEVEDQMKGRPLNSTSKRVLFEESNSRASDSSLRGETALLQSVDIETTADSTQEMELEKTEKRIPTFCGESKMSKLRPLLKSWLTSAPLPSEDDVQMLGNFLKDLVIDWKLDTAHVLLRCLHRNITLILPEKSEKWKEAWVSLANQVQAVTMQLYGKPLRIHESF